MFIFIFVHIYIYMLQHIKVFKPGLLVERSKSTSESCPLLYDFHGVHALSQACTLMITLN